MRFIPNLNFNTENLSFIVFGTLACVRKLVYAYTYIKLAYAHLRVFMTFIFQKLLYFVHKRVIFSIKTFLKSLLI